MHRILFFVLWFALIALWLSGCAKASANDWPAPGEQVLSDGITTCELLKDQFGHVYERSNIPLERCFGIWLKDNSGQDHYEEWFHKQYGAELSQQGRDQAKKHLLGRS